MVHLNQLVCLDRNLLFHFGKFWFNFLLLFCFRFHLHGGLGMGINKVRVRFHLHGGLGMGINKVKAIRLTWSGLIGKCDISIR